MARCRSPSSNTKIFLLGPSTPRRRYHPPRHTAAPSPSIAVLVSIFYGHGPLAFAATPPTIEHVFDPHSLRPRQLRYLVPQPSFGLVLFVDDEAVHTSTELGQLGV